MVLTFYLQVRKIIGNMWKRKGFRLSCQPELFYITSQIVVAEARKKVKIEKEMKRLLD